jgi:hypothetical protein
MPLMTSKTVLDRKLFKASRGMKVVYAPGDVPCQLYDCHGFLDFFMDDIGDKWCDTTFLKASFPRPTQHGNTTFRSFPGCMILSCKTLHDRLVFVNFWVQLSDLLRDQYKNVYSDTFEKISKSAILKKKYNPQKPKLAGPLDSEDTRIAVSVNTNSHAIVKASEDDKKRTTKYPFPRSNAQLRDAYVKSHEHGAQKRLKSVIKATDVQDDAKEKVVARFMPILLHVSTAVSPGNKVGRPTDQILAQPKISLFGPKEEDTINALAELSKLAGGHGDGQLMLAELRARNDSQIFLGHESTWPCDIPKAGGLFRTNKPIGTSGNERLRTPSEYVVERNQVAEDIREIENAQALDRNAHLRQNDNTQQG